MRGMPRSYWRARRGAPHAPATTRPVAPPVATIPESPSEEQSDVPSAREVLRAIDDADAASSRRRRRAS